jgi:hypothetical protein
MGLQLQDVHFLWTPVFVLDCVYSTVAYRAAVGPLGPPDMEIGYVIGL